MTTREKKEMLVNHIVSAFGNEHFNPDTVINDLQKEAEAAKERGEIPGSIWAVMNILPEITELAKNLY